MSAISQPVAAPATASTRWIQLVLGLIAMMSISSPQYVWTLFTKSFQDGLGGTLADIQWTFSILIILQTWLSPIQGYLVDKFGPRLLIAVGCLMSGAGLDHFGLCHQPDGPLSDLWPVLRCRHRHRLYRHHRIDGALVPRPARLRDRHGRRRLWLRRHSHHLPDRYDAEELRLPAHPGRVRNHSWHRRRRRGPGDAYADIDRQAASAHRCFGSEGCHAGRDAEDESLLADVHHDDHDVDRRADDHLAIRLLLARLRRHQSDGLWSCGIAAGADH